MRGAAFDRVCVGFEPVVGARERDTSLTWMRGGSLAALKFSHPSIMRALTLWVWWAVIALQRGCFIAGQVSVWRVIDGVS